MLKWLSALIFIGCSAATFAEPLVIPGTGASETPLKELAKAFNRQNPGDEVVIPPSTGTAGGIRAVVNNESVLARVARPLKENEIKSGLRSVVFARDAIVFVVGAAVDVQHLTTSQLVDIYSGKITNWKQVGGADAPIRVLTREPTETSLEIIKRHLAPFRDLTVTEGAKLIHLDSEMIEMLDIYKNAIGFSTQSSLPSARSALKPVTIDRVAPTLENMQSGKYELLIDYSLIYREGRLNESARKFLDYLRSEAGQKLLKSQGLVVLRAQ